MMRSRALPYIVFGILSLIHTFNGISNAIAQPYYIEGHISDRKTNEEGEAELFLPGVELPEEYYINIEGITFSGIPFNHKIKVGN